MGHIIWALSYTNFRAENFGCLEMKWVYSHLTILLNVAGVAMSRAVSKIALVVGIAAIPLVPYYKRPLLSSRLSRNHSPTMNSKRIAIPSKIFHKWDFILTCRRYYYTVPSLNYLQNIYRLVSVWWWCSIILNRKFLFQRQNRMTEKIVIQSSVCLIPVDQTPLVE